MACQPRNKEIDRGFMEMLGNWQDEPCYYVSVIDGPNRAFVAGPFREHAAAISALEPARKIGCEVDPKASFYGWGTARNANGYRICSLNDRLAAINPSIHQGEWPYSLANVLESRRQEAALVVA